MKKLSAILAGVLTGVFYFWIVICLFYAINYLISPNQNTSGSINYFTAQALLYALALCVMCLSAFWGGWVGTRILGQRSNLVSGVIGAIPSLFLISRHFFYITGGPLIPLWFDLGSIAAWCGLPFVGAMLGERALE